MLSCKRSKFSLPKNITYLNCSYMSPMMKSVEKAGLRGVRQKRNPVDVTPQDFFTEGELLRKEYASVINAPDEKRIAIIPAVSYGMGTVAKNLRIAKGQHVIVAAEQFPSNYYVWQEVCSASSAEVKVVAPPDTTKDRGRQWNERILEAIDKNTRAVAIAHCHWADGTKFDLEAIRKRTRDVGGLLVIDGTQSVGALPFDVQKIQPDALVCAGYKWLFGPYGIGMAYYGEYFNDGKPLEENWINRLKSEDFSGLVIYQDEYQPGALRYDVGEHSSFIHVPMMLTALKQLNKWHVSNVQEYCQSLTAPAIEMLRSKGYWIEDENFRSGHLIGLRLPAGMDIEKIKTAFLKNKIYVSYRGSAIRISPNIYNDQRDMQRLVKVLTRI